MIMRRMGRFFTECHYKQNVPRPPLLPKMPPWWWNLGGMGWGRGWMGWLLFFGDGVVSFRWLSLPILDFFSNIRSAQPADSHENIAPRKRMQCGHVSHDCWHSFSFLALHVCLGTLEPAFIFPQENQSCEIAKTPAHSSRHSPPSKTLRWKLSFYKKQPNHLCHFHFPYICFWGMQ